MKTTGRTVLVTGGTSGIGLALAKRLVQAKNEVIVCGRREEALAAAKREVPALHTFVADTGSAKDRQELFAWATRTFPNLDVLVNNAGIQRKIDLVAGAEEEWIETAREIAINLEGPIHLCRLFLPHLLRRERATIANVSSGLAFVAMASTPVYCATKAGLHSFTQSLRHQLARTSVEVVEIVPPAVRTNLGGSHDFGTPLDEYADSVMAQLAEGRPEVTYEFSEKASRASRDELDAMSARLSGVGS